MVINVKGAQCLQPCKIAISASRWLPKEGNRRDVHFPWGNGHDSLVGLPSSLDAVFMTGDLCVGTQRKVTRSFH